MNRTNTRQPRRDTRDILRSYDATQQQLAASRVHRPPVAVRGSDALTQSEAKLLSARKAALAIFQECAKRPMPEPKTADPRLSDPRVAAAMAIFVECQKRPRVEAIATRPTVTITPTTEPAATRSDA